MPSADVALHAIGGIAFIFRDVQWVLLSVRYTLRVSGSILPGKVAFRKITAWRYTGAVITLYTMPFCPYCAKVKNRIDELAIPYEEKSIENDENLAALLGKGGKRQVPFMVDGERGVSMYESDDIISYFEKSA